MDETRQDRCADRELAERLLRGGVGWRYVRRTLRELRDHRRDLVARLVAQGHDRDAAVLEARQLLGDRNELAAQMIARPELRSRTRRFAWLLFVVGPMPMAVITGLLTAGGLLGTGLLDTSADGTASARALEIAVFKAALQWTGPLMAGLLLCFVALRSRLPMVWPLSAAGMAALASGVIHVFEHNKLTTVAVGLPPPSLARTFTVFCVIAAAYLLLRRARTGKVADA